jgi:hypothetical protein
VIEQELGAVGALHHRLYEHASAQAPTSVPG